MQGGEGAGENCSPRLSAVRLSRGKLAWLRLGSTQPIFDNSRSFHRDPYLHARIIPRTYVFYIDLITDIHRHTQTHTHTHGDRQDVTMTRRYR